MLGYTSMKRIGLAPKKPVAAVLPAALVDRMDAHAREAGISRGEFLRTAITDHCRKLDADAARQLRLERARAERTAAKE